MRSSPISRSSRSGRFSRKPIQVVWGRPLPVKPTYTLFVIAPINNRLIHLRMTQQMKRAACLSGGEPFTPAAVLLADRRVYRRRRGDDRRPQAR